MLCPNCKCQMQNRISKCPYCGCRIIAPNQQGRASAQQQAAQKNNRLINLLSVLLCLNLTLSAVICTTAAVRRNSQQSSMSADGESKVTQTSSAADSDAELLDDLYLPEGLHFFMTPDEADAAIYRNYSPLNSQAQTETSLTGTPIYDYFFDAPPAGFGRTAAAFSDCPVRLQLFFDSSAHTLTQINLESECSYTDAANWGCYGNEQSAVSYQKRALEFVSGFADDPRYVEYPLGFKNGNQHQYRFTNPAEDRMLGIGYHAYDRNTTVAFYSYWCYYP